MCQPKGVCGSGRLMPPPPPVTFSNFFAIAGSETAIANVASARDAPAGRSAGSPNRKPITPVSRNAIGIVSTGRIPAPIGSQSGGRRYAAGADDPDRVPAPAGLAADGRRYAAGADDPDRI